MARLLKSVYFKASYSRLCTYSTKANPYIEVLKTLKYWEEDLRSRSKHFPKFNEDKVLDGQQLSKQSLSRENGMFNENLPVKKDGITNKHSEDRIKMTNENIGDNTSSNDKILKSKNSEVFKEKSILKECNVSGKKIFSKTEEFRLPHAVHSSSVNISSSKGKLKNELSGAISKQEDTKSIKHLKNSKQRTRNKSVCDGDSENIKKKSKKSHSKTLNLPGKNKKLSEKSDLNQKADPKVFTSSRKSKKSTSTPNKNVCDNELPVAKNKSKTSKSSEGKSKTSERKAKTSEGKSKTSEGKSKTSEGKSKTSGGKSKTSEGKSKTSEGKSKTSEEKSKTSEGKSKTSEGNSKISEANSKTAEEKSKASEGKSKNSGRKSKPKLPSIKEDQRLKIKQENTIQSLKCLIEAYINANEIIKAQRIFEYLNHDKTKKEFIDIDLYNIIISGWAREGRLDKVKHLFLSMSSDKIVPNLQTFAYYLEAISRSKCVEVAEIPKIVNEMKLQGFTPKELLQKCIFMGDQREKVIEALGFVERDLSLPLYVPEKAYSCKLLDKLNDKDYEKGENHFNFCFEEKDIPTFSTMQMDIECYSSIKIKSVEIVPELNDKVTCARKYMEECENLWRKRLTKVMDGLKVPKKINQGILGLSPNQSIYPYLKVIDTEILVNLLLQEVRMLGETAEFYSPNIKTLYRDLGMKVMRHYCIALNKKSNVTDKVHFLYKKYLSYLLDPDLCAKYSPREYWEFLKSKYSDGPTIDVSEPAWQYSLLVFIGSILYDVLRSNICFNPNRVSRKLDSNFMYPAFHIVYENHDVKLNRQIRAHDMFSKLYRDAKLGYLEFDVSLVPMLSPPHPWVKYDSGGLLITKVPFIRFPDQARSLGSFYAKVPSHQLNPCFDSLNNLSLCPWIINKPLLDIVIKIFQEGGSEELDIPLDPAKFELDTKSIEASDDNEKLLYKLKMKYEKEKCEMTSLWFDCLYKLSIANHFRENIFWFPHNLDFRGRVYPTPPHFNHLGSDMSRSILLFAAGKPLGTKGLDWLKMHLINLTGFKKRSPHAERLEYANEMLPEILDSADNPFGERKWWMKSDKPLQTLACCKELANALRHPNPEEYISHLPIHQDGSCNGLQHYAALGRDELGAIEVNLHPSNSPQDVYSGVAALVEKERQRDASAGLEIAQALESFVTRKVVKQTVMTFVYGVTSYGARLQVLKQLKDMPDFPEKHQHAASAYLMKKIFFSIKEMFTATKKIQDWFTYCAEEITRATDDAVEWITPLGLPVIQPYYKETIGNKENINYYVSHFEPYQLPNIRKQKNAFPPNFIHSLDSTHMMLTSLFCHRKGVMFVSVHDCYWTHACTVPVMNEICREQFVSLHSEPILQNLSDYFLQRYASATKLNDLNKKQIKAISKMQDVLKAVPDTGTFDLNRVINSEYFFS